MLSALASVSILICCWSAPGENSAPQLTGTLSLAQALNAALTRHPDLAAQSLEEPIAAAQTLQAGLRPNPEISVELEGIRIGNGPERESRGLSFSATPEGAFSAGMERTRERQEDGILSGMEATLRLSQIIELGGKRAARIEAANKKEAVARWDYEVARYRVAGEVMLFFTEALVAQERVRLARQLHELSERTVEAVAGQVAAGEAAPLEEKRARAAAERLRIRVEEARQTAALARISLAGLWGAKEAAFDAVRGDLSSLPEIPPLEQIMNARRDHPLAAKWQAELARRKALIELEEARAVPDLTLALGYRAERAPGGRSESIATGSAANSWSMEESDGDWSHSIVLEASLPLPIFDRNQGAREAARLEAVQAVEQERAALQEIDAAIARSRAAAVAAKERAEAIASRLMPQLAQVRSLTKEGYEYGKYGLLELLDAETAVAEAELEETEARIAFVRAAAQLESILGTSLQESAGGLMKKEDSQ